MAEAHSAVAFSFHVTPDGVAVRYNHDALRAVWHSGVLSWKLRVIRFKNHLINTVFPAPPTSFFLVTGIVTALQYYTEQDLSFGILDYFRHLLPEPAQENARIVQSALFGVGAWCAYVLARRYLLKLLLLNHSWMYEPHGAMSISNRIWIGIVQLLKGSHPLLYAYQSALPKQPVPSLKGTHQRYLASVRPLTDDAEYERLAGLAEEFFGGALGPRLQRYLTLKSWWSVNYVADWWEEYVYLRSRSPIMVNSNYYGLDAIFIQQTKIQAARAANMVVAFLTFRELVDHEALEPLMVKKTVPLCSQQYERMFNLTRIPGVDADRLVQAYGCNFIAVYHKGKYYKVYTHIEGKMIEVRHLEQVLQWIIDDSDASPAPGEEHLAALTAGERRSWALARQDYFSTGVNRASLDAIEKSTFVLSLDADSQTTWDEDDHTKVDEYAKAMLHGKCYDRWFDKSFTLIVTANGRVGFNAEHSWADAPILSQLWEFSFHNDQFQFGYDEDGHCKGEVSASLVTRPIRLIWDIPEPCINIINSTLSSVQPIADDVDLHLEVTRTFGKGVIKKCKTSPDAFIQLALQLAYFRDAKKFSLTYEASMTRLFREGRTETVRPCTIESSEFVRAVVAGNSPKEELRGLLEKAAERHQSGYRDAMTGHGIDRHLFCLYVVSKYLGVESGFLKEVLSEPWRLSTSQTPHSQMNLIDVGKRPDCVCAGGGFGPVSDDGYGVSYIIAGEHTIFFHVSSKYSCADTDSLRFSKGIIQALADLKEICTVDDC